MWENSWNVWSSAEGIGDVPVESLWVRIKEQDNVDDIVVSACCRPPDQEEQVDETFFEELEVASHSQAMLLVG